MPVLQRFRTPGGVPDRKPAEWSRSVKNLVAFFDGRFAQFYDPTVTATPPAVGSTPVVWSAFPASLRAAPAKKLEVADRARRHMDEYCEWGVERTSAGKVTRVTFTTEVPEYFEHLFTHDRDGLLDFYRTHVSPDVKAADLVRSGGYLLANKWNAKTDRRPAHLIQASNTLRAAVQLVAEATILRRRKGQPVTSKQRLVECGGLGNPFRNSDPQIAVNVNDAARSGAEITFADPAGLYLDGLITGGMIAPDGADPSTFWTVERGTRTHAVRAVFEVPKERGYSVGDIRIGGQPIRFGGQVALRVRIRVDVLIKPGTHSPTPQPCVGGT